MIARDPLDDLMVAEGYTTPRGDTPEEQEQQRLAAWQRLIDSGLVWTIQGSVARHARRLIDAGLCRPAPTRTQEGDT